MAGTMWGLVVAALAVALGATAGETREPFVPPHWPTNIAPVNWPKDPGSIPYWQAISSYRCIK